MNSVKVGTTVNYHGSQQEVHGVAKIVRHETDTDRYFLVTENGTILFNVRRESFTVEG